MVLFSSPFSFAHDLSQEKLMTEQEVLAMPGGPGRSDTVALAAVARKSARAAGFRTKQLQLWSL